jgi:WD40 repeat protein
MFKRLPHFTQCAALVLLATVAVLPFGCVRPELADGTRPATQPQPETGEPCEPAMVLRHPGPMRWLAFSKDGKYLAVAGTDDITIWDAVNGQKLSTIKAHKKSIMSVTFSPDSHRLLSASMDMTARIWSVPEGQELLVFKGHVVPGPPPEIGGVTCALFSPDGKLVASGGSDGCVRIWDPNDGTEKRNQPFANRSYFWLAYSPDGNRLAINEKPGVVVLDVTTGKQLLTVTTNHRPSRFAFSPDGRYLAMSYSRSCKDIILWDALTGVEMRSLTGQTEYADGIAFSPDGKSLASVTSPEIGIKSHAGVLRIWEVATGKETLYLWEEACGYYDVAFSPDGQHVACAGSDRAVVIWDLAKLHGDKLKQKSTRPRDRINPGPIRPVHRRRPMSCTRKAEGQVFGPG